MSSVLSGEQQVRSETSAAAFGQLGDLYFELKQWDRAEVCFLESMHLDPQNEHAAHRLVQLTACRRPEREAVPWSTPQVADVFDRMAPTFDEQLLHYLHYQGPAVVSRVLQQFSAGGTMLDLGCGTGLIGAAARPFAQQLHGVDLSPRMIEMARKREIYDELTAADLCQYLQGPAPPAHWLLALDVLVYVGPLDELFRLARQRAASQGRFLLTTELPPDDQAPLPWSWQPAAHRYAHCPAYVEQTAQAAGWRVEHQEPISLRTERQRPVLQHLFVLQVA